MSRKKKPSMLDRMREENARTVRNMSTLAKKVKVERGYHSDTSEDNLSTEPTALPQSVKDEG
jgi:hypothetical protein